MAAWLEDLVGCRTTFRHAGAAEFALERSDRFIYDYLNARKNHFRILLRQIVFALGLQAIASTALLGLGGWLVMSGQLTLGQLVAAELIVTVIVGSFAKLGKHVESYYDVLAAVDKLGALIDLEIEKQDGLLTFPVERPAVVQMHNLSYSGGQHHMSEMNGMIDSGERVVVTGYEGDTDSLILDLLFGTRLPSSGYLTINGVDPRDLRPDALRRHVSLIRDIEIFEGTIAENVHLERPHVSTHDVREALLKVGLLEKILSLPEGLDTELNETGFPLTSTQLKKLMIARGIVSSPRLLLVDEIVDGLSDDDAELISEVLFAENSTWTLVMVTGRERFRSKATRRIQISSDHQSLTSENNHG